MKSIFRFFGKISNVIRDFLGDLVDIIEAKAPIAVKAVQKIKEGIESNEDTIQWIINKTETEVDDEAFALIKQHLPTVAKELATVEGLVGEGASTEEATAAYLKYIEDKAKAARAKEFIILAAALLQALITKKMPLELLILATQKAYHLIFKKASV
jgi:hypothetical protein